MSADLSEFLKLKYLGNCKCGQCQLVPIGDIKAALHERTELLEALKGVVRVADRQTVEFEAAHAAIAKAEPQP